MAPEHRAAAPAPDGAAEAADPPARGWGVVGAAAVDALGHRVELVALEAAEARDQLIATGALAALAAGLALLAGLAGTLLVAWLVRDQPAGWAALAGLALAYLGAAAGCIAAARARWRRWRPFATSAAELRKDGTCLQTIMSPTAD